MTTTSSTTMTRPLSTVRRGLGARRAHALSHPHATKSLKAGLTVMLAAAALSLSACSGSQEGMPAIAPVTMSVEDLHDQTIELTVGQMLNITTGDLDGESYNGEVADPDIAIFVPARKTDSAEYNPGIKALARGETTVTLSDMQGGIENVTFTVDVASE